MYDLQAVIARLQDLSAPLSHIQRQMVRCFYGKLEGLEGGTDPLFALWREELTFTYGDLDALLSQNTKLRPGRLEELYGIAGPAEPLRLLKSIQSFYSVLIKYITYQMVSGARGEPPAAAGPALLRDILFGGAFRRLGVENYCYEDWFSWLLKYWDGEIEALCLALWRELEGENTIPTAEEFARAFHADSLKELYETVMPREIRHALGEYYTPDWLAGVAVADALQAAGRGADELRMIDPTCGSGAFLIRAIRAVREAGGPLSPGQVAGFDINALAVLTAKTGYLAASLDGLGAHPRIVIPIYHYDVINTPEPEGDLLRIDTNCDLVCQVPLEVCRALAGGEHPFSGGRLLELLARDSRCAPLWERLSALDGLNQGVIANILLNRISGYFQPKADVVLGNPPWVNWEYLPRKYKSKSQHLWPEYGLFQAKGRELSFSKEDISVLITYLVIDRFLADRGWLCFILRQAMFKSAQNGARFRRFRLGKGDVPFRVAQVEDFCAVKPFEGVSSRSALVLIRKGEVHTFPVPYFCWRQKQQFPQVVRQPDAPASAVLSAVDRVEMVAIPANKSDPTSLWVNTPRALLGLTERLLGSNPYQARTGVFTGGANGVYWLDVLERTGPHTLRVRNIVERAKRKVPQVETELEDTFVYPMVQGSDITQWHVDTRAWLLCPHTAQSKMWPVEEDELKAMAPKTYRYLQSFRADLDGRKGFSGWEKEIQAQRFYAVLRVGAYTFARYKVAWRYIAQSFITAVIPPAGEGLAGEKLYLPNEKVMYVALDCEEEAYYLCGVLSAAPISYCVKCYMNPTSISAHVLDKLNIPPYDGENPLHRQIAALCRAGHQAGGVSEETQGELDRAVCRLYALETGVLDSIRQSDF